MDILSLYLKSCEIKSGAAEEQNQQKKLQEKKGVGFAGENVCINHKNHLGGLKKKKRGKLQQNTSPWCLLLMLLCGFVIKFFSYL